MTATRQPSGSVTLMFTDIEGSTRLLEELGTDEYREALAEHRRIVRDACDRYDGYEVDYEGDAFFYAFNSAEQAVRAISEAMDGLTEGPIRIRVGIHTGEPAVDPPKYVGIDVHQAARIMSAAHGGQVLLSAETYSLLEDGDRGPRFRLVSLGAHRLKDIGVPLTLYQLGEGSFPPLKTIANTNLPTPASSFLGREKELWRADLHLRDTRLLTVTGPGGAGKTRFALELARRAREERFSDYPDGVFSCFLAALRDPALVVPLIARALSLREQPGISALEVLASHLGHKRMLLVLDNLEHLLPSAAELSELLARCPGVTLVCTSRELLRITGELAYELPPLRHEESVSLFCERARIEPTPAIRELCRRLDGLPLALELAAARMRLLSPEQLLERLSQRLDLLTGGRDADPRQQTLRATIQWSHDLLTREEQELFARLAVFAGGSTLEAAEAVCDADPSTLESLLDKSLLRRTETPAGPHLWMHETIRQYAAEQLERRGETPELRRRHAEHYLALAERAEQELRGSEQETWLERVVQQDANVAAAVESFIDMGLPASALRIGGALTRYWERRGRVAEGRRLLERALREGSTAPPEVRAKALYSAGFLAFFQDDREGELAYYGEAIELYRQCGDDAGELLTELELAYTALLLGDVTATHFEHYVHRALALEDKWIGAYAFHLWGDALAESADLERAKSAYLEAVTLFDAVGDLRMALNARASVGWVAVLGEEYREAASVLAGAVAAAAGGDTWMLLVNRNNLGVAMLFLGEDEHATLELCASLRLSAPMNAQRPAAESLLALAAVAARASRVDEAVHLRGASLALHEACGAPLNPAERRIEERYLAMLGEPALSAGAAAGRSMTLDDAATYASELAATIRSRVSADRAGV